MYKLIAINISTSNFINILIVLNYFYLSKILLILFFIPNILYLRNKINIL